MCRSRCDIANVNRESVIYFSIILRRITLHRCKRFDTAKYNFTYPVPFEFLIGDPCVEFAVALLLVLFPKKVEEIRCQNWIIYFLRFWF